MATSTENSRSVSVVEAYDEALRYFMGQGILNRSLAHLVADLKDHDIEYVVIGAAALLAHGYRRLTEDIDLVFTAEGLKKFHERLIGLGYEPAFPGARKRLRSTRDGIRIDVIEAGEYPGDGRPKPVKFPTPAEAAVVIDGVRFTTLEKLIELKLASGMTAPDRLKDLADVQELIKIRTLNREFAEKLDPYVKDKFLELLDAIERGSANEFQE